jgi:hypothetical protein
MARVRKHPKDLDQQLDEALTETFPATVQASRTSRRLKNPSDPERRTFR